LNCWRAKSLFSAQLDNELGRDETQELNEHLADCPECRGAMEELRRMKRLVGGVNYRLPERFSDEVLQKCRSGRVEADEKSSRPMAPVFRFALAAGLLVSAVGAAFLVLDFDTESTTTETTAAAVESTSDATAVIIESEELVPEAEPVAQTAGNYLTDHLANSEVAINSDDVISRHMVADEAIAKASEPSRMAEAEVSEEQYYSDADFSLVSTGAALPGVTASLPLLPAEEADAAKPLNLEEFFESNAAAGGE